MTILLSKAIKKIERLSPELQDQIAESLLEDIDSELEWQKTFAKRQPKLDKLARKALKESEVGKTKKLGFDDL